MALFFVPKGTLADPRDARNRESSASGAARRRGILSFSKESIPLKPPRERTRGLPPRPRCIGSFRLEELRGLRNLVRCTWLRHGSLRFVTTRNRALLREARVTIAQGQTLCGAALLRSPLDGGKKRPRQRSFSSMGISPCSCSKAAMRRLIICSS